jgi:hypothetical protein
MATSELLPTPTQNGNYNRKGASKNSGDGLATKLRSSPEVFPVSLFPKPGKDEAIRMTVFSGRKCFELYENFSRHGLSLKTCVAFLLKGGDGIRTSVH